MSERDDGGPAFPHPVMDMQSGEGYGMTLRDYFAAAALSAGWATDAKCPRSPATAAASAYAHADAMLAERAK